MNKILLIVVTGRLAVNILYILLSGMLAVVKSATNGTIIDPVPVREYDKVCAIVLLSVLLYQLLVYYNCKTERDNPMAIKYMLGT